jgi:O-antigen/teichoic acid export membrane protein
VTAIRQGDSIFMRLASYWGRSAAMIMVANGIAQALGLVSTIVLAYFLSLSEYGRYALTAFFASIIAIAINAGSLQGTMMMVFGGGGDDDDGADDDDQRFLDDTYHLDRRRALTSTLFFTLLIAATIVGVVWVFATPLTHLLLGRRAAHLLVVLAAASGGLSAVWRYMVNVLRMERRIVAYCFHRLLRPITVVIAVPVLMSFVGGIRGALFALIGGTVIGLCLMLAVSWRSYRLAVSPADYGRAMRVGAPYVLVNIGVGFVHTAGVYLLAGYRSSSEVARFSVASSAAAVNTHYISGLLMSFSPVRRTPLFKAAQLEEEARLRNRVVTVFVTTTLSAGVVTALLADEIIRVLPASYQSAAGVIPFALLGWATYGIYMVIYRMTTHDHKRAIYVLTSVLSVGMYVGFSALLDPRLGAIGQGLAMCLTYAMTGVIMVFVSQQGEEPLQLDGTRLVSGIALAGGCVLGFHALAGAFPSLRLVIDLAGIASYFVLLVALRIVPWSMVLALLRACRGMFPRRGIVREVQQEIQRMPASQALVLMSLGQPGTPQELASGLGMTEREFELRIVAALRELSGLGGPRPSDMRIGNYLLSPLSRAERDVLMRRLQEEVNPGEIDLLETSLRLVRRATRRAVRRPSQVAPPTSELRAVPAQSAGADPRDAAPLQPEMP